MSKRSEKIRNRLEARQAFGGSEIDFADIEIKTLEVLEEINEVLHEIRDELKKTKE